MTHEERFGHAKVHRSGNKYDCLLCHRRSERERRRQNPEASRKRASDYQRKNRAACSQRQREWRQKHKEEQREYFRNRQRRLSSEHKRELKRLAYHKRLDYYRAYGRTAQMRRHGSRGAAEYAEMVRADPCCYCGGAGGQADHIEPLADGGPHHPDNLTGACIRCNSAKGDRSLLAFLLYRAKAA
jgi:5-methylcytosine-specific restriction endonuclease McrA